MASLNVYSVCVCSELLGAIAVYVCMLISPTQLVGQVIEGRFGNVL